MSSQNKKRNIDRRSFLRGMSLAAGGLAGSLTGCDAGEYIDYLTLNEDDKVTDRFYESISGHAKKVTFPPSVGTKFSFLWVSDIHITRDKPNCMDKIGDYAKKSGAVFVLHSGDCVDRGKKDEYQKLLNLADVHLPVPFYSALGNHDIYNDGWDRFRKYIGPSVFRRRYSTCEFIFIDTAAGTLGKDQMDWLEDTLDSANRNNRFILSHYPVYDGAFQTPSSMGNVEECMKLVDLMDKYKVDYFLCGHKHCGEHYEVRDTRHIISGAGCPYKEILGDDVHLWRFDIDGSHIGKKKVYL